MKHIFTLKKCPALVLLCFLLNGLAFAQESFVLKETQSGSTTTLTIPFNGAMPFSSVNEKPEPPITTIAPGLMPTDIHLPGLADKSPQLDAPLYVVASTDTVCSGDSIYLHATCNAGTVTWYLTATGTSPIGTGAPFTFYPITTSRYYVACQSDTETSSRASTNQVIVFSKPSMPTDVKVNKTTVCRGSEVIISASCTDGTLVWFRSEIEPDSIGHGTNLSATPMDATRYYAACTNGICVSNRIATEEITVMDVPDEPTQVAVDRTEICSETNVYLSATCSAGQTNWYNTSAGGAILDGGGTQYPAQNGMYYCVCTNNMCESPRVPTVEIKVTPQPKLPTLVIASKTSICKGESITLTANCEIGTVSWYTYLTGPRTFQGTGNALTVVPDSTTTYFAACENGLCVSERVHTEEVVVSNNIAAPTNVAINYTEVCSGNPVLLSADFSNGTLKWYTAANGGTSIGTGTNLSHSPTANTIYYAACESGSCSSNRVASTELKIKPKPAKPVITGRATICNGESIQLTSSPSEADATCYWSNGLSGFSVSVAPASSIGYRVLVKTNTCVSDSSDVFAITVNPLPAPPTITTNNAAICKGGSAMLTGQSVNPADNFYWGTPTLTNTSGGSNKSIRVVTEPGIYKGWSEAPTGCVSAVKSITITQATDCNGQNFISILPEKPAICPNSTITLTASGCSGIITWMDGNTTKTGTAIQVSPGVTTSYMAQCSTGGMGATDVVVATANVMIGNHIATGTEHIKATHTLESAKKIGEPDYTPAPNVSFEAGGSIVLKPGFVVEKFSTFLAVIRGCE